MLTNLSTWKHCKEGYCSCLLFNRTLRWLYVSSYSYKKGNVAMFEPVLSFIVIDKTVPKLGPYHLTM